MGTKKLTTPQIKQEVRSYISLRVHLSTGLLQLRSLISETESQVISSGRTGAIRKGKTDKLFAKVRFACFEQNFTKNDLESIIYALGQATIEEPVSKYKNITMEKTLEVLLHTQSLYITPQQDWVRIRKSIRTGDALSMKKTEVAPLVKALKKFIKDTEALYDKKEKSSKSK